MATPPDPSTTDSQDAEPTEFHQYAENLIQRGKVSDGDDDFVSQSTSVLALFHSQNFTLMWLRHRERVKSCLQTYSTTPLPQRKA